MHVVGFLYTVPNAPNVHSVPLYDHGTTHLKSIQTTFEELVSKQKLEVSICSMNKRSL